MFPALQRTQGWGTLSRGSVPQERAGHPPRVTMKKKKSKRAPAPDIPPLSLPALDRVQKLEDYAQHELRDCRDSRSHDLNVEKAKRIARTCAVAVLDALLAYYESLPAYDERWIAQLQDSAIESVVGMIPKGYEDDLYEWFRNLLLATTYAHLNPPKLKPKPPQQIDRTKLKQNYLSQFDEPIKILDICWAAQQHYREWKRWIHGELRDASTPDRAFRRVLASDQTPLELAKKPRPKGWQ
jgi:hypothetical protein